MIVKKIGKHEIKLYDSIDDMPIINFQKYNKFLLIDSGVGSDLEDIDLHITKIANYIQNDRSLAIQELQNMRQAMYFVNQEISPRFMAFTALIYEIDGERLTDLTDDNLKAILTKLTEVKRGWLEKILDEIKKKVNTELETFFPAIFDNAKEKEAYDKLKHRTNLVLDSIINEKNNAKEIRDVDSFLLNLSKPKPFYGSKSAEVQYSKQFENTCISITQRLNINAKALTVFEFYTTLEQLKKQLDNEIKAAKKKQR